jgi:hypothetical protein
MLKAVLSKVTTVLISEVIAHIGILTVRKSGVLDKGISAEMKFAPEIRFADVRLRG